MRCRYGYMYNEITKSMRFLFVRNSVKTTFKTQRIFSFLKPMLWKYQKKYALNISELTTIFYKLTKKGK